MVTATPTNGLCMFCYGLSSIKAPDNPFYQPDEAAKLGITMYANPEAIPYELTCLLQDEGMLPDALLNSLQGTEHGRELLQANRQFLTDYFFHRCREKDYHPGEMQIGFIPE